MRIKIKSDGFKTQIVNAETDEPIERVVEFSLSISQVGGEPVMAHFTVVGPELDMEIDAELRKRGILKA